jgi:serine/threonine protein kinase
MGERVRVVRHEGRLLAAKEPGRAGSEALRSEAELLRRVQGPGVVELVGMRGGDAPALLTRWVGPRSLADVPVPMTPERSAAIVLAVAATVGRLHRAGVVHGDLDPTHVLLDADGRPVLCGFGSAGSIGASVRRPATDPGPGDGQEPAPLRPATDVAGLGRLLEHLIGTAGTTDGGPRWGRAARATSSRRRALGVVAAQATVANPAGRPSVSAFAHAVRRAVPDARLMDEPPAPRPAEPRRPRDLPRGRHARADEPPVRRLRSAVPAVAALVAIGATTYFGLSAWWAPTVERAAVSTPAGSRTSPATTTTTTSTSTSSATSTTTSEAVATTTTADTPTATTAPSGPPVIEHDGRHYEVGAAGDVVLVGQWLCDGRDLPVVLHTDDGTIHLFTGWAGAGGSLAARTVTSVPGASGLGAASGGLGCTDLLVTRAGQVVATIPSEELR